MTAPGCQGSVYGCSRCDREGMTIHESIRHDKDGSCTGVSTRCRKLVRTRPRIRAALCALPKDHEGDCDPVIRDPQRLATIREARS